jgi:hypothetical protein
MKKNVKKNWLLVEVGSRGEINDVKVVKGSWNDIEDDLKTFIKESGEDDEDYIEEFFGLDGRYGNEDDDVLICGKGEEDCDYYIDYDKYLLECRELNKLFKEGNISEFHNKMEKFW